MAYWHKFYEFPLHGVTEHEYTFAGRYGAKGEKREKKKKPTKEQMAKQNQTNRENRMRRVMLANFRAGDLWCCCKYPEGTRMPLKEVTRDKDCFLRLLRQAYKKRGYELKYIYRLEIGAGGGIHFHILINRMSRHHTDIIMAEAWSRTLKKSWCSRNGPPARTEGLTDWKTTYEAGGFRELACYITKQPREGTEEYEQLSLFEKDDRKKLLKTSTSRNLVRPEPEKKYYSRRTMRRLVDEGPRPREGYYIDYDTLYIGKNPCTGLSYCRYTEVRLDRPDGDMFREETLDAGG